MTKEDCETAAKNFFPNPRRNLQVGSGCTDGWEHVPIGCSIQSGGDGAAHYKTKEDPKRCSINRDYLKANFYQLVCQNDGKFSSILGSTNDFVQSFKMFMRIEHKDTPFYV